MSGYRSATITPEKAAEVMRDVGIKIETQTLRAGLEQGAFPFGIFIERNRGVFIISKKKLSEWLEDFAGVKIIFDDDSDVGEVVRT